MKTVPQQKMNFGGACIEHTIRHSCGHTRYWSMTMFTHQSIGMRMPAMLAGFSREPCLWCGGEGGKSVAAPEDADSVLADMGNGYDCVFSKHPQEGIPKRSDRK